MAARSDNVTDPELAAGLVLARWGQSYFSRKVNELGDGDFDAPSLVPGWSRRHVVAHVGLNARALTHLTEWAATGVETPMYDSVTQRDDDIEFSATLPVSALRNLSAHAAVHLNVEWRDLPEVAWTAEVLTAQGRRVPVSETVWMRTREVWIHAVDLDNGGSFDDFPPALLRALLVDLDRAWSRRAGEVGFIPVVMQPTDWSDGWTRNPDGAAPAIEVGGTLADLVAWGTGRGAHGVTSADGTPVPPAPRWL